MSTNAIEFQNVSLRYPVQRVPSLKEWGINLLTGRSSSREGFTALRDVTLDIVSGEATAIIGANGAGKSTLLRLAAGVIPPTAGEVVVRGRVAPLLELGTGFDLELSGRENILFNGALLGRTRSEMLRRFDEIVDFSGLESFIEAPLRTYSTGMISRLAFSIATSVDAEVVLIDEILSVGDAEFRVKCEDRIRSYARSGATLVVVSHEMDSVQRLCTRAIWIGGGRLLASGDPEEVIATYERSLRPAAMEESAAISRPAEVAGDLEIRGIDPSFIPAGKATRVEVRGQFRGAEPLVRLGDHEVEVVNRSSKRLIIAVPSLPAASAMDVVVEIGENRGVMRRALVVAPEDVPLSHPFARWIETALRFDYMRPIDQGLFGSDRVAELNDVRHSLLHAVALRESDATDAAARVAAMKVLLDRFVRERGQASGGENVPLRRRDVAVLLLKAKHGPAYVPPPVEGLFADVNPNDEDAPYLEQLYRERITSGCAVSPLRCCPDDPITRAQLAKFVVCAFE